ncbi:hypothetical protein D3C84_697190 [compost metagenome]
MGGRIGGPLGECHQAATGCGGGIGGGASGVALGHSVVIAGKDDFQIRVASTQRQRGRLEVAGVHGSRHGVAAILVKRGPRGPAFADTQRTADGDLAQRRIAALYTATSHETLAAVRSDALQVDQHAIGIQRHQQLVIALAQAVGANALGDQIGVARVGASCVTPPALSKGCRAQLALALLGLALLAGLLDALAHLFGFTVVGRFTAVPGVGAASLPTAERTRGDAIEIEHVPPIE